MQPSAPNVALRAQRLLSKLDVTADTLEAQIQDLIEGVADLDDASAEIGMDLRKMPQLLRELAHSSDQYHNGETVLQHIQWVLEDVDALTEGWEESRRRLLRVVAMLHDLGKAYTHAWDEKKQKNTFNKHDRKSLDIARVLLARFEEDVEGYRQSILDLVEHHDAFFRLGDNRTPGSTKYLKNFAETAVSVGAQLENMALFAHADSRRSQDLQNTLDEIQVVLADIDRHRALLEQQRQEQEEAGRKAAINIVKYRDEIAALVDAVAPGISSRLPDLKAVNGELGKARAFNVIKQVQAILAR